MAYADSGSVSMALMVQSEITLPVLDELGTRDQKEEFLRPAIAGDHDRRAGHQRARRRIGRGGAQDARAYRRR